MTDKNEKIGKNDSTLQDEKLRFNGVKVFSATMAQEREHLGEKITQWLDQRRNVRIVDKIVTQSSDEAFHCIAITVFYWEERSSQ